MKQGCQHHKALLMELISTFGEDDCDALVAFSASLSNSNSVLSGAPHHSNAGSSRYSL